MIRKTFSAKIHSLNLKMDVVFSNKGVMPGILVRTDQKNGTVYYTSDYHRFLNLTAAEKHQSRIKQRTKP